ncbi:helix-turn-helix domain-containing protein [Comamonas sp. NoAH]|uniref:helix-turn-helix domain-containing protein n=1 Tax=Comamonas halotolerans TaxID=3041496 RepID=UPI0024E04799|nr:helix-turn-helix transcriptional regulator [Comamonas sp. NoAH]
MIEFASRLLHARSDAGITQRELSEITGISTVQLSRYESGKSTPRPPVLMKLAKALAVNHEWLKGDDTYERDAVHAIELEIPDDKYKEALKISTEINVPVHMILKYLMLLGASRLAQADEKFRQQFSADAEQYLQQVIAVSGRKLDSLLRPVDTDTSSSQKKSPSPKS